MRQLRPSGLEKITRILTPLPSLTDDIISGEVKYYNPNGKHDLGASKRKQVEELEKYEQKVVAVLRGPNSDTHYLIVNFNDIAEGRLKSEGDTVSIRSFCNGVYETVNVSEVDGVLALI